MPHYVLLVNWTERGITHAKGTVDRTDEVARLAEKHGGRLVQYYWTVGPYDLVGIAEAPDDESASAFALELSSSGNIRTTTMRAYDREQMSGIVQRLG